MSENQIYAPLTTLYKEAIVVKLNITNAMVGTEDKMPVVAWRMACTHPAPGMYVGAHNNRSPATQHNQ